MGIFEDAKKRKDDWKAKRVTKFRNQSYASYKETEEASSVYRTAMEKVNSTSKDFCYTFKSPKHEKWMLISKKANFWSLFAFAILAAVCCILFGCMKLSNLVSMNGFWDKDHKVFDWNSFNSVNLSLWFLNYLPQLIVLGIVAIYLIFYLWYLNSKQKKYQDDPNFKFTFNLNVVWFIIFIIVFFSILFSISPFNITPANIISSFNYNTSAGYKVLDIITFVFDTLLLVSSITYIASTIICLVINPKFDKSKLNLK